MGRGLWECQVRLPTDFGSSEGFGTQELGKTPIDILEVPPELRCKAWSPGAPHPPSPARAGRDLWRWLRGVAPGLLQSPPSRVMGAWPKPRKVKADAKGEVGWRSQGPTLVRKPTHNPRS